MRMDIWHFIVQAINRLMLQHVLCSCRTSHLLQGDSLSDGRHQTAPRVPSRGRCHRSGDLPKLNLSTLQRGQHFIHSSCSNTTAKENRMMEEAGSEECTVVILQFVGLNFTQFSLNKVKCTEMPQNIKQKKLLLLEWPPFGAKAQKIWSGCLSLPGAQSVHQQDHNWGKMPPPASWGKLGI